MTILGDFRAALGADPQPWHQRLLRAGVRPAELATAVMQYLRDHQQVGVDGVVVPNVLRITLGTQDHERLARYGVALPRALGTVVVDAADDQDWVLAGPVKVRLESDETVRAGTYRLVGRVEPVDGHPLPDGEAATSPGPDAATQEHPEARPADGPAADGPSAPVEDDVPTAVPTLAVRTGVDAGSTLPLTGARLTAGRGDGCDLVVRDTTVSREHAAFVRRGETWWVLDLGSTNGTRVNDLRAAEHPIAPGDRIMIGDVLVELVEV